MTVERWRHDPPCTKGGFSEVSALVMADGERCPLCGAALVPPESVRRAREAARERDERMAAAWKPSSPDRILAMARHEQERCIVDATVVPAGMEVVFAAIVDGRIDMTLGPNSRMKQAALAALRDMLDDAQREPGVTDGRQAAILNDVDGEASG